MISRTRFNKQIVAEFIAPKNKRSRKIMIICHGLPSIPKKNELMQFFADRGYWVFFPRYRGTWESDGQFLKKSPHLDVLDIIDGIEQGFNDLWTEKKYQLNPSKVHLLGSSFGGPAVILASRDSRVDKVIAVSPVTDWTDDSKVEPLDWLGKFIQKAFGNAYRFKQADWNKLIQGDFYNPINHINEIDGKKLLLFHAKDDVYVPYKSVKIFAKETGAKLITFSSGGHFSTSQVVAPKFFSKIKSFLN